MRMTKHHGILELHEVYEDKLYIHLVLPLLTGDELYRRMKQRNIVRETDAVPIMKNLLKALEYLHS